MSSNHKKFIEEADFVKDRIETMIEFRKQSGCETIWKNADEAMKIKPLRSKEALNYRSNKVNLKTDEWQSDNSDLSPFSKIHIALSVLAEQNPRAIFKNYIRGAQTLSHFHSKLYDFSLNKEFFKFKLNRFIYNQGKYGVSFACTKARNDYRSVRDLIALEDKKETYEVKSTEKFKGVWFEPLSNWQVYWDDAAELFDPFSMNDWAYYKYYTKKQIEKIFPDLDVKELTEETQSEDTKDKNRKNLYKIWFYENRDEDLNVIYHNDKVLDAFPIPTDQHNLSINYAIWNMRDDSRIDGVGLVEILQQDKNLFDKVSNMSVDQLILSIYKSFFYDGTNEEDGILVLRPGRGQQVLDPSKIKFVDVPGNGSEVYKKMEMIKESMDANTFSKTLGGETLTGKTAYEIEQIKNSSVRRLSLPLDGLKFALTTDAYNRIDILHSLATTQDIEAIFEPEEAEAALAVYKNNPEIFRIDEEKGIVYRFKYPEVPLALKKEGEKYLPSKEINFFPLTPEAVRFNGDIEIDVKSILLPSPELEKQQVVTMSNLLLPLFQLPREIAEKPAREILRIHNYDEKDWFPEYWLKPIEEQQQQVMQEPNMPETPKAGTFVEPSKVEGSGNEVGQIAAEMAKMS